MPKKDEKDKEHHAQKLCTYSPFFHEDNYETNKVTECNEVSYNSFGSLNLFQ